MSKLSAVLICTQLTLFLYTLYLVYYIYKKNGGGDGLEHLTTLLL